MKILNEEHFENVKRYAESIGDTSLQKCLERLKSWEENPDHPCEISLYYDHAPYSFGFTQCYPDGRTGIVGGLLYHGIPDRSFAVTLQPFQTFLERGVTDGFCITLYILEMFFIQDFHDFCILSV